MLGFQRGLAWERVVIRIVYYAFSTDSSGIVWGLTVVAVLIGACVAVGFMVGYCWRDPLILGSNGAGSGT